MQDKDLRWYLSDQKDQRATIRSDSVPKHFGEETVCEVIA